MGLNYTKAIPDESWAKILGSKIGSAVKPREVM